MRFFPLLAYVRNIFIASAFIFTNVTANPATPQLSDEIQRLQLAIPSERLEIMRKIEIAAASQYGVYASLLTNSKAKAEPFRQLISIIGGMYPNDKKSTPEKKLIDAKVETDSIAEPEAYLGTDWAVRLATISSTKISGIEGGEAARANLLFHLSLLRGLAYAANSERSGAPPEVSYGLIETIFSLAISGTGPFQDETLKAECSHLMKDLGIWSVPVLISKGSSRDLKTKVYANALLKQGLLAHDSTSRLALDQNPISLFDSSSNEIVQANLLRSFGENRTSKSLDLVIRELNNRSDRIRKESRIAFIRYLNGNPPEPKKQKRQMTKGRESKEPLPNFATYRERAEDLLRDKLRALNEKPPRRSSNTARAQILFRRLDQQLEQERLTHVEKASSYVQAKKWEDAASEYSIALAYNLPGLHREEISKVFEQYAQTLVKKEAEHATLMKAAHFLRQARLLTSRAERLSYLTAYCYYLDGLLSQDAKHKRFYFERAAKEDPSFILAQEELSTFPVLISKSPRSSLLWGSLFIVLFALVAALFWAGRRK